MKSSPTSTSPTPAMVARERLLRLQRPSAAQLRSTGLSSSNPARLSGLPPTLRYRPTAKPLKPMLNAELVPSRPYSLVRSIAWVAAAATVGTVLGGPIIAVLAGSVALAVLLARRGSLAKKQVAPKTWSLRESLLPYEELQEKPRPAHNPFQLSPTRQKFVQAPPGSSRRFILHPEDVVTPVTHRPNVNLDVKASPARLGEGLPLKSLNKPLALIVIDQKNGTAQMTMVDPNHSRPIHMLRPVKSST